MSKQLVHMGIQTN